MNPILNKSIEAIAKEAIEKHNAFQLEQELVFLLKFARRFDVWNVLEIGCGAGGMLWAWQQLGCRVVGVNLANGSPESRVDAKLETHGARVIVADSSNPATVEFVVDEYDLVFIDGDHTFHGVSADYVNYAPLVKKHGLIMFHDIYSHAIDERVEVYKLWNVLKIECARPDNPDIALEITASRNPYGIGIIMKGG